MKLQNKFLLALISLVVAIIVYVVFFSSQSSSTIIGGTAYESPYINTATTTSSVAVTSSTRVLATTTNSLGDGTSYTRLFASICNPNANVVYIRMDGDKAASNTSGIPIAASAGYDVCYYIGGQNPGYNGSVTASSTDETSVNILVTDYVL